MTLYVLIAALGFGAALMLGFSGYLFGIKRSTKVREQLIDDLAKQGERLQEAKQALAYQQGKTEVLQADSKQFIAVLEHQAQALERMIGQLIEPLVHRHGEVSDLRLMFQQLLAPIIDRHTMSNELGNLDTASSGRSDLNPLLDQIAEKGQFQSVLLSDQHGLPLAASRNATDLDRLAALSSMVLLFVDRVNNDGGPAPLAFMIHDEENRQTLCRIFRVRGHRLMLTAVSRGTQLTPTSLDPTLPKLDVLLSAP